MLRCLSYFESVMAIRLFSLRRHNFQEFGCINLLVFLLFKTINYRSTEAKTRFSFILKLHQLWYVRFDTVWREENQNVTVWSVLWILKIESFVFVVHIDKCTCCSCQTERVNFSLFIVRNEPLMLHVLSLCSRTGILLIYEPCLASDRFVTGKTD